MKKSKKGFSLLFAVVIAVVFMTFLLAILIHSSNGISNLGNHISQMQASVQSNCAMRLVLQYFDNTEFENINLTGSTKTYVLVTFSKSPNSEYDFDETVDLHILKDNFVDTGEKDNSNKDEEITDNKDRETDYYLQKYIFDKAPVVGTNNLSSDEEFRTLVRVVYDADSGILRMVAYTRHDDASEVGAEKDGALGDTGATNKQIISCRRDISLDGGNNKNGSDSSISRAKVDFAESSEEYNYVTVHVKPYKNAEQRPYIYIWTNRSQNMTPWIVSSDNNLHGPTEAMEYIADGWYEYTARFLKKNNEKSFNAVIAYKGASGFKRSNDIYALPIKSDDPNSDRNDVYITLNSNSFYSPSSADGTSVQSYKQTLDKYFTSYTCNKDMYMIVNFKVGKDNENVTQNCPEDFTYQGYGWYKRILSFKSFEEKKNYTLNLKYNSKTHSVSLFEYAGLNEIFIITDGSENGALYVFTSESEANTALKDYYGNTYAHNYANVNLKLFNADANTNVTVDFNPPETVQPQTPEENGGESKKEITFYFEAPLAWGNSPSAPPVVYIEENGSDTKYTMTYISDSIYKCTYDYSNFENWSNAAIQFSNNQEAPLGKLYKATGTNDSKDKRIYINSAADKCLFKVKDYKKSTYAKLPGYSYNIKDGLQGIGSWYAWSLQGYNLNMFDGNIVYLGIVNTSSFNPENIRVLLGGTDESSENRDMHYISGDTNGFNYYFGCLPSDCKEGRIEILDEDDDILFGFDFECDETQVVLFVGENEYGEAEYKVVPFGGLSESYVCDIFSELSYINTKSFDVTQNTSQGDNQSNDDTESDFDKDISYSLSGVEMAANSGYKTQFYNVAVGNASGFSQDEIPGSRSGASISAPLYDWYIYKVPIKNKEYNIELTIENRVDGVKRTYTVPEIEKLTSDVYITVNNYNESKLTGDSLSLYMMNPDENDVRPTVYFENANGWSSPRIEYRTMYDKNTSDSSLAVNKSDDILYFTLPENCVGFKFYDANTGASTEPCSLRYGTYYDNIGRAGANAGRAYLTVKEQLRRKTDEALATLNNCCVLNKIKTTINGNTETRYIVEYENKLTYKSNSESPNVYFMEQLAQTVKSAQNLYAGGCYSMTDNDVDGLRYTLKMIDALDRSANTLKKLYGVITEARLNLTQEFDVNGKTVYAQAYPEGNERPAGYRLSANSEYLVQKQHDNAVALYLDSNVTDADIKLIANDLQNCLEYKQFSIDNAIGIALVNSEGWDISDDNVKLRIEYKIGTGLPAKEESLSIQNNYGGFNYILRDLNELKDISVIQFVYKKSSSTQTSATFDVNLREYLPPESPEKAAGTIWLFDNSAEEWVRSAVNDIYTVSTYEIEQENGKSFLISSDNNYASKLKIHFQHDTVVKFTKDTAVKTAQSTSENNEKEYVIYSGFYNITDTFGDSIDLFSLAAMRYFGDCTTYEFTSELNGTSKPLKNSYDIGLTDLQGKLRGDTSLVTDNHSGEILNLLIGGTRETVPGIDGIYVNTVKNAGALGENLALTADRINFRWVRGKNKFFALDNSIRLNANIITIGTERINYSTGASFVIEDMATSEEAISYLVLMNDVVLHSEGNDEADTIIKAGTYAFAGSINLLTESDRLIFISNETNAYNNKGKMRLVKTEDSEIIYGN